MIKCRMCGGEVIWSDQHIIATPDGDAWMCSEPRPETLLGTDKRRSMDNKTRQAIETDKLIVGRGFGRLRDDGTVEHIPAARMLIFAGEIDPNNLDDDFHAFAKLMNAHTNAVPGHGPACPSDTRARDGQIAEYALLELALILGLGLPKDERVTIDRVLASVRDLMAVPHPMYLTCPKCNTRHIDEGEFATKPHHTHACQNPECGLNWRPMIASTVGVKTLPGALNEPKRNPLDPGDGPMEIASVPNSDGSYSVHRTTHHKGCPGGPDCGCSPIRTTDRHYR